MKVLMISIDKGLVGGKELGDVVERHRKYGEHVEVLDIIVLSKKGFTERQISKKVKAIPTNSSSKFGYFFDALRIAKKKFQIVKSNFEMIPVLRGGKHSFSILTFFVRI